jgi:hypothetical protein
MYVNAEDIKNEILKKVSGKINPGYNFTGYSDQMYYKPTFVEFRDYVKYNKISISPSNPIARTEGFDCDDYSFLLKGHISVFNREIARKEHSWAVGIIWGEFTWMKGLHATNWIATRDSGLWLYEPQYYLDGFYPFDQCTGNVQLIIF